jgi:Lysyl oxidase
VRAALSIALCCAATLAGTALATRPSQAQQPRAENPCIGPQARLLLCPDLVMNRPWSMYAERYHGRTLLRAGNAIDSIGKGPAELFGTRIGPRFMRARQRIYKRGGGRIGVATDGRLQFKLAHLRRYWWKFYNAARFELWRVDGGGKRTKLVRAGPKVAYCLRDLVHTRPALPRSPRSAQYPACSSNSRVQHVTLGTSVGWADVYPPTYPEQWIDVTGLRGCFAYAHIADPNNRLYESNEDNNEAQLIVRLPFRPGERRTGCRGPDRGKPYGYSPY